MQHNCGEKILRLLETLLNIPDNIQGTSSILSRITVQQPTVFSVIFENILDLAVLEFHNRAHTTTKSVSFDLFEQSIEN
jgi:hypothetical protein